jgi:hypothetical protein
MGAERSRARVVHNRIAVSTADPSQTRRCVTVDTVVGGRGLSETVTTMATDPERRRETRAAQFCVSKAQFFLVRSTGWQAMLKYSNRFYTPYDPVRHNYPYMQNRRLSTILQRYRWRARSAYHRPQLIIGAIWIVIIATILFHV